MARPNERKNGLARTLEQAERFVQEIRMEVERAAQRGEDVPPRLRSVHERQGHASPEFRTKVVPLPDGGVANFPGYLAQVIGRFAAEKRPDRLMLALEAVQGDAPVVFAEVRDREGNRRFRREGYRVADRTVVWEGSDGWVDPGQEEMILDSAF